MVPRHGVHDSPSALRRSVALLARIVTIPPHFYRATSLQREAEQLRLSGRDRSARVLERIARRVLEAGAPASFVRAQKISAPPADNRCIVPVDHMEATR